MAMGGTTIRSTAALPRSWLAPKGMMHVSLLLNNNAGSRPPNCMRDIMRHLLAPLVVSTVLGFASVAHAQVINYATTLSGANEAPPNSSPGTGTASALVDEFYDTMRVQANFSGLTTGTTAAHIHCCTADPQTGTAAVATMVPTFSAFPLGVTSGTYDFAFDLLLASTYNPAFITAHGGTVASAEADLLDGLAAGTAYFNIHTTQFPNGEVRGFLIAAPIPEPGHLAMLMMGLTALAGIRRWRHR
jgi:hypothetical protein